MQQQWNNSLLTLLLPCSQIIPTFEIASSVGSGEPQEDSNELEKPEGKKRRQTSGGKTGRRESKHLFRKHAHVHRKAHQDHFDEVTLGEGSRACSNFGSDVDCDSNLGSDVNSSQSATSYQSVGQDSEGGDSVTAATNTQVQDDSETGAVPVRSTRDLIISKDRGKRGIFDEAQSASGRFTSKDSGKRVSFGAQSASGRSGVAIHSADAFEGGQGPLPPHFDSSPDGVQSLSGTPTSGENKPAVSHGGSESEPVLDSLNRSGSSPGFANEFVRLIWPESRSHTDTSEGSAPRTELV
ncbi:unnamed protein product [Polarella glacialis]|uniref:Uncharacterized protein n=1 Tax=Polarella glacialis TaxID=89957 RepID=A0A813LUK7_POLGL|nr:unnamed protein product [Polarella glacialis]CAE8738519.1 unnamed protein product [Polarella glacialis]